jgi:hypothetical protein
MFSTPFAANSAGRMVAGTTLHPLLTIRSVIFEPRALGVSNLREREQVRTAAGGPQKPLLPSPARDLGVMAAQ